MSLGLIRSQRFCLSLQLIPFRGVLHILGQALEACKDKPCSDTNDRQPEIFRRNQHGEVAGHNRCIGRD